MSHGSLAPGFGGVLVQSGSCLNTELGERAGKYFLAKHDRESKYLVWNLSKDKEKQTNKQIEKTIRKPGSSYS